VDPVARDDHLHGLGAYPNTSILEDLVVGDGPGPELDHDAEISPAMDAVVAHHLRSAVLHEHAEPLMREDTDAAPGSGRGRGAAHVASLSPSR
jgi:hypothetical protein